MNANGQRFSMLADAADWRTDDATAYDAERRLLTLARRGPAAAFAADAAAADAALARLPHTIDDAGARYWVEGDRLMALGIGGATAAQTLRSGLGNVTDLAACDGAMLAVVEAGALLLIDLTGRCDDLRLNHPTFVPFRLSPAPSGGAWMLDRAQRRLARFVGSPRAPDPVVYAASTVRPCADNSDPPRLVVLPDPVCAADADPVALACNRAGEVAVLIWRADGGCLVVRYDATGAGLPTLTLGGLVRAHALAWTDDTHLAFMLAGASEAPVYAVREAAVPLDPNGDYYPLRRHAGGPFVNALLPRAHFLATPESGAPAPKPCVSNRSRACRSRPTSPKGAPTPRARSMAAHPATSGTGCISKRRFPTAAGCAYSSRPATIPHRLPVTTAGANTFSACVTPPRASPVGLSARGWRSRPNCRTTRACLPARAIPAAPDCSLR